MSTPPPLPEWIHPLEKGLKSRLRAWRSGSLRSHNLRWLAGWLAGLILVGMADFFAPIPEVVRGILVVVLTLGATAGAWWTSRSIRRTGEREMAAEADRLLADDRFSLLQAWELRQKIKAKDISPFLADKQIADAQLGFHSLPPKACRPRQKLRQSWVWLMAALGVVFLLMVWQPWAAFPVLGRLLVPWSDIPPASRLQFQVMPQRAEAIYGGDLEVRTRISGGSVNGPVTLMTRAGGEVRRIESFRGQNQEFSQRLEQIVQPMEFSFAVGNARSRWQPISLLMEPRFALARFSVTPPAYTGQPAHQALLGTEELRGLQGSEVRLTVTSNRPLSQGTARLIADSSEGSPHSIIGRMTGQHTIEFAWTLQETGEVQVQIEDVFGTPCAAPLVVRQTVLPDEKPRLFLSEPGTHVLATPTTILPVAGTATDDYALRRVDFVRGMPGVRPRMTTLVQDQQDREFEFTSELDLGRLGVQPGEILELFLEGRDYNPNLTGLATSSVNRVEIISEEEYAARLWQEISSREIVLKLSEMQEILHKAREALLHAEQQTAATGNPEQIPAVLEETENVLRQSADALNRWSEEFPAFAMEEMLHRQAGEASAILNAASARTGALRQMEPSQSEAQEGISDILQMLEGQQGLAENWNRMAQDLEQMEEILRLAAEFRQLVEEQKQLASWADRILSLSSQDMDSLRGIEREQPRLQEILQRLPEQLREAAESLQGDKKWEKIRKDTEDFAGALEHCGARESMKSATLAAKNREFQRTSEQTAKAAEQLAALLDRECSGGGACDFAQLACGASKGGQGGAGPMGLTYRQLVTGLLGRSGAGLLAEDGYAVQGQTMLPLPTYGPMRQRLNIPANLPVVESFGSMGEARSGERRLTAEEQLQVAPPDGTEENSSNLDARSFPEKYRSALKRYFALPDSPTPNSTSP